MKPPKAPLPTDELARLVGVKPHRLREIARERGVLPLSRDIRTGVLMWRPEDAPKLKPGPVGNPNWVKRPGTPTRPQETRKPLGRPES